MLTVSVISPEAVLYEGTTDSVVAPAFDGEVGILTGHAPMMTLLGKGVLRRADRIDGDAWNQGDAGGPAPPNSVSIEASSPGDRRR